MISYMKYIPYIYCNGMDQVAYKECQLKHAFCPNNTFHQGLGLDLQAAYPREELCQLVIGVYGDYVIPSSFYPTSGQHMMTGSSPKVADKHWTLTVTSFCTAAGAAQAKHLLLQQNTSADGMHWAPSPFFCTLARV